MLAYLGTTHTTPYQEISLKILSEFTTWRSDKSARIYLLTPNSQPSCGDAFLALPGLSTVPHNLQYLLFAMSLSGAIVWWQQDNQINYWHTQPSTGVAGQTLQPQVASHEYCSNGKSRNSLCSFLHCLDDVFISLKPVLPISWSRAMSQVFTIHQARPFIVTNNSEVILLFFCPTPDIFYLRSPPGLVIQKL